MAFEFSVRSYIIQNGNSLFSISKLCCIIISIPPPKWGQEGDVTWVIAMLMDWDWSVSLGEGLVISGWWPGVWRQKWTLVTGIYNVSARNSRESRGIIWIIQPTYAHPIRQIMKWTASICIINRLNGDWSASWHPLSPKLFISNQ